MPPEKRKLKEVFMQSRSNVVYENWKVYSQQGKLMFRCNEKKAQWYLKRQLATCLPETRAIQLTFKAKGDGHRSDDYMVEDRVNACVACASTEGLTLHHVVPDMYRRWMPLVIKSKSSRDLLLLCKHCHDRYERDATALKKQFAKIYDIPLEGKGWVQVPENREARKAASALLRHPNIPEKRREELADIVKNFQKPEWADWDWEKILTTCCELKDQFQGPDFVEHGEYVVAQLMKSQEIREGKTVWPDLEIFVKQWRQHFMDHLQPKHLSERWSVDGDIYTH
ncbi:hypothetical protein EC973_004573 [Apophysomyces ossiformis]|uniref:HNH domain-containing protein n=1 Tax=Apophysomyces ossiformis TaxID=679940 RepID=A0A8H7ERU5_9FUNG|nr:hypothetical protein EC973_004573 [Apophysomyces ossiformis]